MRPLFAILCLGLLFFSCGSAKESKSKSLTGNWLLLYPDHRLKSGAQRTIYRKYQDSIVSLYGLKLLQLSANGEFKQIDSIFVSGGKWEIINDSLVKIKEGGKGFNPFTTTFTDFTNDTLQLTQFVSLEDEQIKLVWYFKKITTDNESAELFTEKMNSWRRKPTAPESEPAMRKRIADMLNYYGEYFKLVSREAIYFSQARVPLPFAYYQHSIGMILQTSSGFQLSEAFKDLFFNWENATKAYSLLETTLARKIKNYPTAENFGTEYGLFMKQMAEALSK